MGPRGALFHQKPLQEIDYGTMAYLSVPFPSRFLHFPCQRKETWVVKDFVQEDLCEKTYPNEKPFGFHHAKQVLENTALRSEVIKSIIQKLASRDEAVLVRMSFRSPPPRAVLYRRFVALCFCFGSFQLENTRAKPAKAFLSLLETSAFYGTRFGSRG